MRSELLHEAVREYGDTNATYRVFSPATIHQATPSELEMILLFLDDDPLPLENTSPQAWDEFTRWVRGEEVFPWSAGFTINWLVLRYLDRIKKEANDAAS